VKLEGKVVVVTGGTGGVGAGVVRRFSAEGAHVVLTDLDAAAVDSLAEEVGGAGLAGDITDPAHVEAVAALARERFGRVDVWFSNAGWAGPRQPGDLQDDAIWQRSWALHVLSHVYACRAVLPEMLERGDGYLLQTASSVALSTQPEKVAYSVTKHGALALAEWLAVTYRPRGIKVSCYCPGAMLTPMLLSNQFPDDHPVLAMAFTPEQVADVLVQGIAAERFLIVNEPETVDPLAAKAADYDAWIDAMAARGGL